MVYFQSCAICDRLASAFVTSLLSRGYKSFAFLVSYGIIYTNTNHRRNHMDILVVGVLIFLLEKWIYDKLT